MTDEADAAHGEAGNGTIGAPPHGNGLGSGLLQGIEDIPVEVVVAVGRARPAIREVLGLRPGSVLSLEQRIDDPVELYLGERRIGRGHLVELDEGAPGQLGIRLTDVGGNGRQG